MKIKLPRKTKKALKKFLAVRTCCENDFTRLRSLFADEWWQNILKNHDKYSGSVANIRLDVFLKCYYDQLIKKPLFNLVDQWKEKSWIISDWQECPRPQI
jgi:hypothetical protein